jgi:hypothetical protein
MTKEWPALQAAAGRAKSECRTSSPRNTIRHLALIRHSTSDIRHLLTSVTKTDEDKSVLDGTGKRVESGRSKKNYKTYPDL